MPMLTHALLAASLIAGPVSTDIALPAQPAPLHGTLLTPEAATAVAVILPGSGPTDRDGNSPMGVAASTYRLLAPTPPTPAPGRPRPPRARASPAPG